MQTRTLGAGGLVVSAIGLGCIGLSQGYGHADDAESLILLQRAIDLGVTLWDTAQSYGAGHNEELIGKAIAGRRAARCKSPRKLGSSAGRMAPVWTAAPTKFAAIARPLCDASERITSTCTTCTALTPPCRLKKR